MAWGQERANDPTLTYIIFLLYRLLELLPLFCHWILVLNLPGLGVHLRVIEKALRQGTLLPRSLGGLATVMQNLYR